MTVDAAPFSRGIGDGFPDGEIGRPLQGVTHVRDVAPDDLLGSARGEIETADFQQRWRQRGETRGAGKGSAAVAA
jgi:hypothetical protein